MRRERDMDTEYDEWRQRMVDALWEGEEAGRLGLAAGLCPYYHFESEYNEWHRGRMRTILEQRKAVVA